MPESFRYFKEFLPVLRMEWSGISLKIGRPFFDEWQLTKAWLLDETSPFETLRTLDPSPVQEDLRKARVNLERAFPAFKGVATAGSWGGMIDATPDLVPVISEVESLAGLVISTGFSGHGFGIGPAAGRLAADLVTGAAPVVDPSPFRYERFIDGTKPEPTTGV